MTEKIKSDLEAGLIEWERWPTKFPDATIFDGESDFRDPQQGEVGNCWIVAGLISLGAYDERLKDTFITQEKNDAGIHAVKFYIRGKPWVVDIDDRMAFVNDQLYFGQPS